MHVNKKFYLCGMKPYRYIALSAAELETLENGYKNGKKFHFRTRCHSLLLSHRGFKVVEIATLLKKDECTVRRWMDNWEHKGIVGLFLGKGRGKKPALVATEAHVVELVKKKSGNSP